MRIFSGGCASRTSAVIAMLSLSSGAKRGRWIWKSQNRPPMIPKPTTRRETSPSPAAQPSLERLSPARPRGLHREIDEIADDEARAAHFTDHGERHFFSPGEIPEATEVTSPEGDHHARLALPEEQRIGAHALLERDARPQA